MATNVTLNSGRILINLVPLAPARVSASGRHPAIAAAA